MSNRHLRLLAKASKEDEVTILNITPCGVNEEHPFSYRTARKGTCIQVPPNNYDIFFKIFAPNPLSW